MVNWTSKSVRDNLNSSKLPKSRFSIFVYGSLRPGEEAFARICHGYKVESIPAWTNGRIYHLEESYPILLDHESGRVFGNVLFFDSKKLLKELDIWESFDENNPDKGDYKRINILAYLFNGQIIRNTLCYAANIHYTPKKDAIPFSEWPKAQ